MPNFGSVTKIFQYANSKIINALDLKAVIQYINQKTTASGTAPIELTGSVTGTEANGIIPTTISNSGVTAGAYTAANITVGADGRVTAAANGTVGTGSVTSFAFTNNSTFSGSVATSTTTPNLTLTLLVVDGGTY